VREGDETYHVGPDITPQVEVYMEGIGNRRELQARYHSTGSSITATSSY